MFRDKTTGLVWQIVRDNFPSHYLMGRVTDNGEAVFTEIAEISFDERFEYIAGSEAASRRGERIV